MPPKKNNRDISPDTISYYQSINFFQKCINQCAIGNADDDIRSYFKTTLHELGFLGFSCHQGILGPLSDNWILLGNKSIRFSNRKRAVKLSKLNYYNDLSDRGRSAGHSNHKYRRLIYNKIKNCPEGQFVERFIKRHTTPFLLVSDAPKSLQNTAQLLLLPDRIDRCSANIDCLCIPLENTRKQKFFLRILTSEETSHRNLNFVIFLATCYHEACLKRTINESSSITAADDSGLEKLPTKLGITQLECIKWAVAGKTNQDIAVLTGLTSSTVRYHMEQARMRYGYSTIRQTLVRAAIDYSLDPIG